MTNHSANHYDSYSAFYDSWQEHWPEGVIAPCVDALARIADGRRVLELAVGTGRIALPLSVRGLDVSGVDLSEAMLERLRGKPGAEKLSLIKGNMVDVPFQGPFGLVFIVGSFEYLLTQEDQLRLFANVADRMAKDGSFVVQTIIPNEVIFSADYRLNRMSDLPPGLDGAPSVMLMGAKGDLIAQSLEQRIMVIGERPKVYHHRIRYVWPSELDLLARSAGLALHGRWSNWQLEALVSTSRTVISEYRKDWRD